MRPNLIVLSLILLGSGVVARAQGVKSVDFSIHQEYMSTRAMGMGNAFAASANDFSAIFYNPAMLALRRNSELHMFVRGAVDADAVPFVNQIKSISSQPSSQQVQSYNDLLVKDYGDHFYYGIPTVGAAWVTQNWGIAFIPADLSLDLSVGRQIGPMANINLYIDSTLAFSYAHMLHWFGKGHLLSWGVTAKAIHRIYVGQSVSAGELADSSNVFNTADADEGLTEDLDFGTFWHPPVPRHGFFSFLRYMRPSFAIVGRNLIDYGFKQNFHFIGKNSGEPPRLQRRFDFGTRWDLPKFWVLDPHLTADIRDVGHPNWSWKKGTHVGAELYWRMYNWWKGHWAFGLNEGYWTAGFGARLAWFQLDLASYGEEVGTDAVPKEDRRYMAELSLDF